MRVALFLLSSLHTRDTVAARDMSNVPSCGWRVDNLRRTSSIWRVTGTRMTHAPVLLCRAGDEPSSRLPAASQHDGFFSSERYRHALTVESNRACTVPTCRNLLAVFPAELAKSARFVARDSVYFWLGNTAIGLSTETVTVPLLPMRSVV